MRFIVAAEASQQVGAGRVVVAVVVEFEGVEQGNRSLGSFEFGEGDRAVHRHDRRVRDLLERLVEECDLLPVARLFNVEIGDRGLDDVLPLEGRQIELVPGQRVVQAWRFGAEHPSPWEPGVYSTVRFTLERAGDGTRLVIDHTGIPAEWIEHISLGYPAFYQDPITNFFADR